MKKYLFLIFILIAKFVFAQKQSFLVINNITDNSKSQLAISFNIINNSDSSKFFYIISNSSFCEGLAYLEIIDDKTNEKGFYFPCKGRMQLDNISLNRKNSVVINHNSTCKLSIVISLKNVTVKMRKGRRYKLRLNFNYNNLVSNSTVDYYNQRMVSNQFIFSY